MWRKRLTAWPKLPALGLPHTSVFAIGIAIGLAGGVVIGLAFAWLDGARHPAHAPGVSTAQVAAIEPPKVIEPAPAKPVSPVAAAAPSLLPAYVEGTELGDNDDSDTPGDTPGDATGNAAISAPPLPATPPAVVEPQAQPAATAPAGSLTPEPQATGPAAPATPSATPAAPPAWLANAVASVDPGNKPVIAIVLDDVGAAPADVPGAIALPGPITLSIMTYAPNVARVAEAAHQAGHEMIVHVPMEPINRDADPGKNALLTGLPAAELQRRLDWDLAQFPGYVGINNHMGSKFTQDSAGMQLVLQTLKARGLLFLDSRTIAGSVGDRLAGEIGVTHVKRDVFLDNVIDPAEIRDELAKTEAIARKQGFAIAIGHPHPDTVAVLREWIPEARAKGFILVPLSAIAKRQQGVTG
jgi:hypothetical protein